MRQAQVWVAYVAVDQQFLIAVPFVDGMTAAQAIERSQIRQKIEIDDPLQLGIFGIKITLDTPLKSGDRVEIYRPLTIHPHDIRRKRAQKNPVGRFQRGNRFKQSDS
ncbi:RnfH family protein [Acinetobacter sp. S40]|uniref:RnfH family protein n=1 Tax=unclassified Acinetobacter TaxID=196816 RepID=UPI00190E4FBF|nr:MULTISPECIES: RnfH family protein [unclassified Acinetobacter]MBJ9985753.1 RnfH family protein [Acinetobacter sp. S40]MBK0064972.1 RnfH family protein [Acinetobacter sp. S55]MBK0067337.1 RnfH family protein [Acinetobacter sp. S54]